MDKNTHVYCTNCTKGGDLIQSIINETAIPKRCNGCYPYNPEDSTPYEERPNYIEACMLRVRHNKTGEMFLMQLATDGVRLYSTTDDTGNSDVTISNEEFNDSYEVLEAVENEI